MYSIHDTQHTTSYHRTFHFKQKMTPKTTTIFLKFAKISTITPQSVTDTSAVPMITHTSPTNRQITNMPYVPSLPLSSPDHMMNMVTSTSTPTNTRPTTSTMPTLRLPYGKMLLLSVRHLDWPFFL